MSHTLITFLGRGNYSPVIYRFPDNKEEPTQFFGFTLLKYLRENSEKSVDKFVILGTTGSMWEMLRDWLNLPNTQEWKDLKKASDKDATTDSQLKYASVQLKKALNVDCELRLIDYGKDQDGQIEILKAIAAGIEPETEVSLDITHALRHLPVFITLSAVYLQAAYQVNVNGIYYGAFEMKKPENEKIIAPVLNLAGLLQVTEWTGALQKFQKDGDYSVFSPVLEKDGINATNLSKAAFLERQNRVEKAAKSLKNFAAKLPDVFSGISQLFQQPLLQRIGWYKESAGNARLQMYERQKTLARFYLNRGDYLRTVLFAQEAYITHLVPDGKVFSKHEEREQAKYSCPSQKKADFLLLSDFRNAMAHGTPPQQQKVRDLLNDLSTDNAEQALKQELERLIDSLLGK